MPSVPRSGFEDRPFEAGDPATPAPATDPSAMQRRTEHMGKAMLAALLFVLVVIVLIAVL
jgi:hypothetical protein